MGTDGFKGAMLSTLLMVSLMAPAISLLFTGPASAPNPNGWGISYYADNSSDSYMAKAIISSATPYEHIILIVVDGMRADVLVEADTPNIDNLTASGSFTWNAWTVTRSVTIEAIPSIMTGATPEVHQVNDWYGEIHAETIPEVFEEAGLPTALIGSGGILAGYNENTYWTEYYYHENADEHFTTRAIEYFAENRPFFMYVYNPMPDRRGHAYGHESSEYREVIENADYHIGRLVENLKELGVYESTLIVITPDHGMTGTSHGYGYENDMRIFSIWRGPGVKENYQMVDNVYIPPSATYDETYVAHRIIDIAPTITSLVGLRAPENSEGNIIYQIFEDQIFENLTLHTPILIVGNDNFTPANGVVSGSGTENDPYIIENWDISAENDNGIWIMNTTTHFIIRNCYVHDGGENYYGIYFENVINGKIDNVMIENNESGIYLKYSSNNHIYNNTCENNYWVGIILSNSDNNLISNNLVENNYWGILLSNSDNNLVSNNTLENNEDWGISLGHSNNSTVQNNTCKNNDFGIVLGSSDNNIISNNIVENNEFGGIVLDFSDNNLISNNIVENNYGGIRLWDSDNNLVSNNTCENNHFGIFLWWNSNGNHIHRNNFINNENQAHDDGSNYWDNGYPWGGNYWSDYTGADIYRGEDQNLSGSDRIGDTPYYIPSDNNLDRYPLMNPFPLPWTGWAIVSLPTYMYRPLIWPPPCLYPFVVILETNLALYQGSKLVAKFYTYGNLYQGENVVWSGATPDNVSFSKIVPHPQYGWVEKVRLDMTYNNTENVISTITSFIVRKTDLEKMFTEIPLWWALSPPEDKVCIEIVFSTLPLQWVMAPS